MSENIKTQKKSSPRFRNWCFTIHDYESEQIDKLTEWTETGAMTYLIIGFEIGQDGAKHLQGYFECKNPYGYNTINKLLSYVINKSKKWPPSFPRKGTQEQAVNYCKKGEQSHEEWDLHKPEGWKGPNFGKNAIFREWGLPNPGQGSRTDIDLARTWMKEGKSYKWISENCNNHQVLKFCRDHIHLYEPTKPGQPKVYWFYGPSGCSKSYTAKAQIGLQSDEVYYKPNTDKWWAGYDGHKKILMDELRPDHMHADKLLNLLGSEPDMVEMKYGYRQFRGEEIWVTTSKHPAEFYADYVKGGREDVKQFLRRINKISYFDKVYETVNFEPKVTSQEEEMNLASKIKEERDSKVILNDTKVHEKCTEVAGNILSAPEYQCPLSEVQKNKANEKFEQFLRELREKKSEMSETISEIIEENRESKDDSILEILDGICLKCEKVFEPINMNHELCEECYIEITYPKTYKKDYRKHEESLR